MGFIKQITKNYSSGKSTNNVPLILNIKGFKYRNTF